jgi:hypothetical protein
MYEVTLQLRRQRIERPTGRQHRLMPAGHISLVINRHGQHRLITVARPAISGEMYQIITTLFAGCGSLSTPISAPIACLPIKMVANLSFGRVASDDTNYAVPAGIVALQPCIPDETDYMSHIRIIALPC